MAPRPPVRRERDNVDYSAIGKLGRRTGVILDRRPLDANGMEEISGNILFPAQTFSVEEYDNIGECGRKGCVACFSRDVWYQQYVVTWNSATNVLLYCISTYSIGEEGKETYNETGSGLTPTQALSSRRSTRATPIPPPRSASPRKSGISGTARKSNGVDIFSTRKDLQPEDPEDRENIPTSTPTRSTQTRRYISSPANSPLQDITTTSSYMNRTSRPSLLEIEDAESEIAASVENNDPTPRKEPPREVEVAVDTIDDFVPPADDDYGVLSNLEETAEPEELGSPEKDFDDEEADRTFEPEPSEPPVTHNQANSRRKRKSDVFEHDEEAAISPVPHKLQKTNVKPPAVPKFDLPTTSKTQKLSSKVKGKQPLRNKDTNTKMSSRQERELDDIIEKVRAWPGPPRSLYILRRETPADDSVTHTRSGRVSVKPLAYWRNERCVYGGSPGGVSLADGARFPLNSIREIVRTEELDMGMEKKDKRRKKRKNGTTKGKARATPADDSDSESESDSDIDKAPREDAYAEPWETDTGTFSGTVSLWDPHEQAAMEQEETVEIAHAPAAIKTREVKASALQEGPTFRYAKLLSTKFFGTGLVDLPPGGIKKPKNSRKMQMSFFVVKGRVTVNVGPIGSEEDGSMSRFSIGKGGFWQVPRGNQYSIENELEKPARIFFSQGCEMAPVEDEE